MRVGCRPRLISLAVAATAAGVAMLAPAAIAGVSTYAVSQAGELERSLVVSFQGGEADTVIARNGIPTRRSPATRVRVTEAAQAFLADPLSGTAGAECSGALGELTCTVAPHLFAGPFIRLGGGADTARLAGVGGGLVEGGTGADVLRGSDGTVGVLDGRNIGLGDELYGDAGTDRIIGRAGGDFLFGGSGNDVILAADGEADTVYCWDGDGDRATVDPADFFTGCEQVTVE